MRPFFDHGIRKKGGGGQSCNTAIKGGEGKGMKYSVRGGKGGVLFSC